MLNPGKQNEKKEKKHTHNPPHTHRLYVTFFCQISLIPLWDEVPTALKIAE